jgi:Fe-S-cluster containining protein
MAGDVVVTSEEAKRLPPTAIDTFDTTSVLKTSCDGCVLLNNNYCGQYMNRPKGCVDYPYYNIGGQLFFDKGCPGMTFDQDGRPDVTAITPIESYLPISSFWTWVLCFVLRIW